ncbi:hypothetical protein MPTK1_7g03380 [Marchantia polymorpha subsp. ruderalis]|uniref:Aquaporin n=2 Tax=Marchantia polymorpha TaxID=3197 RepID=A0AAF6BVQ9_MARPO|nr:hypothetical protein MARPO_0074s0058 [Marchantia polymorpha]BBN16093.1 hypothetical protein Mp_7g03380 [Marchantia polymorpha subsp. ruderalis]|eukprot:PTQ35072.1 hypothetical protein MARPO_0074s0058 [Marchantia polymorpha]
MLGSELIGPRSLEAFSRSCCCSVQCLNTKNSAQSSVLDREQLNEEFLERQPSHLLTLPKYLQSSLPMRADFSVDIGLAIEIIGTFFLVYEIYSATDAKHKAKNSHVPIGGIVISQVVVPLSIRLVIFVVHLAIIPITCCGINPTRSFGSVTRDT